MCGHPAVRGRPREGPAAREASLWHRRKIWVSSSSPSVFRLQNQKWQSTTSWDFDASSPDVTLFNRPLCSSSEQDGEAQLHFLLSSLSRCGLMDHLWMSSCQASFYVKVGVVWAVIAGHGSPTGQRRARGRSLGVLGCCDWSWNGSMRTLVEISSLSERERERGMLSVSSACFKPRTVVS